MDERVNYEQKLKDIISETFLTYKGIKAERVIGYDNIVRYKGELMTLAMFCYKVDNAYISLGNSLYVPPPPPKTKFGKLLDRISSFINKYHIWA